MYYPVCRPRRMRKKENLRRLIRETRLSIDNLILPLFVVEGKGIKRPISSMPGHFQISLEHLDQEVRDLKELGIPAVILFGIPEKKDELASRALVKDGVIQRAAGRLKDRHPDLVVITDVCLCEYTSHGHCGMVERGDVDNDTTVAVLAECAVSHARAGADMVAPSAMMDGQVEAIRTALDEEGYASLPIMAYSAKYASSFYGPFREAAQSAPQKGNRKSYQMDPANSDEAIREIALDIEEGADVIMVKPALSYLDVIRRAREEFDLPLAAYNVSGEYAMIKAAASLGWLDEEAAMNEVLTSIKRAGADLIITYFAKEAAALLRRAGQ